MRGDTTSWSPLSVALTVWSGDRGAVEEHAAPITAIRRVVRVEGVDEVEPVVVRTVWLDADGVAVPEGSPEAVCAEIAWLDTDGGEHRTYAQLQCDREQQGHDVSALPTVSEVPRSRNRVEAELDPGQAVELIDLDGSVVRETP